MNEFEQQPPALRTVGGDGFQAAVDPTDSGTVYLESQYGALVRVNVAAAGPGMKGNNRNIRPPAPKGGPANRYNWNAPILLSPHDPKTLYYGGQFLFKSTNRGDAWDKISPELTAPPQGPAGSGYTILATAESPASA